MTAPSTLPHPPARDAALHSTLVGLVAGLFLLPPLAAFAWVPDVVPGLVTLGTVAAGLFLLADQRRLLWPSLLLAIATAAAQGIGGASLDLASAASLALLALALLRRVMAPGRVTAQRIEGAVALYLVLALGFAYVYQALDGLLPGSFAGALGDAGAYRYLSLVVQTSTGFGDIVPTTPVARALVTLQAVTGQMFMAVLLARLVSLELADRAGAR